MSSSADGRGTDGSTLHALAGKAPTAPTEIDAASIDVAELRQRIAGYGAVKDSEATWPSLRIVGLPTNRASLGFFDTRVSLELAGPLWDHSLLYMSSGEIDVRGGVGRGVAAGMCGGVLRIHGGAGDGTAACQSGGTVAIYGNAGHRIAAAMTGGGVFIRGAVGDDCGAGATGGTVVVGGSAGDRLGNRSTGTTFFVRGETRSLGHGIIEVSMRKQAQLQLGVLLMNASIRGKTEDFRRYIHEDDYAHERAGRGAVNPSWR